MNPWPYRIVIGAFTIGGVCLMLSLFPHLVWLREFVPFLWAIPAGMGTGHCAARLAEARGNR